MRQVVLFILLALCVMACQKDKPITPGIFGKWELRRVYGGLLGFDSTYKAGNGTIYQFNSDSTYKHFTNKKQDAQGIFHIQINNNPTANSISTYTILFDNTTYGEPLTINGTSITIGTTVTDGIAMDYQKIGN